ncbi:hypothetical protein D7Y13_05885 [Corallococcus praedator]|uniref:SCP domain-containing protein n=1 Tax=Corallococcus praedator TaxID=2316724 RepID=A0ABX9QR25_9BACT|nr:MULTISPECIES: CAP family protein [Corallococcus]RKH33391.1 hypothetical protein D7X75_12185 [Corallococcus sp. CA031C]RKI14515.1 hypothetical protein D7Y13_05885 [Corallococcus praedator]
MRTHRVLFTLLLLTAPSALAREPFPDATTHEIQAILLNAHNGYRSRHDAPRLEVDPALVAFAKGRAREVSTSEGLGEAHRGLVHGYGENLYWAGSSTKAEAAAIAAAAVKAWYDEMKLYDFKNGSSSKATGHFTQLVWKGTTKVGCAVAQGKGSRLYETYVVCNYQAPGNMMGDFQKNVSPKR